MSRHAGMEKQEAQEVDESRRRNVEHKKTNTEEYTPCDSIWFRNRQQYSMAVEITVAYLPGDWRLGKGLRETPGMLAIRCIFIWTVVMGIRSLCTNSSSHTISRMHGTLKF